MKFGTPEADAIVLYDRFLSFTGTAPIYGSSIPFLLEHLEECLKGAKDNERKFIQAAIEYVKSL